MARVRRRNAVSSALLADDTVRTMIRATRFWLVFVPQLVRSAWIRGLP
jgi:hypothetical protein